MKSPSNQNLPYLMLKIKFPFLYASTSLVQSTKLYVDSSSCSSARFAIFPFLPRVFSLPLVTLLIIVSSSSTLHGAIEIKKKRVCKGFLFSGNLDPSSLTLGGPVVLLVCGFRRWDNLLAWRELFANLYELKSRVWFWDKYSHFEWIYKVYRLDRFSSNFAKTS